MHIATENSKLQSNSNETCSIGTTVILIAYLDGLSFAGVSWLKITLLALIAFCLSTAAWPAYIHWFKMIGKTPFFPPEKGWGFFVLLLPLLLSLLLLSVCRLVQMVLW